MNKSQLKLGVILNYVNIIVGNLIPLLYTPVMLRLLGQSEYGLFKLSSTYTSYLGLVSLGLGGAVGRYLIKAKTEKGKQEEEKYYGLFINIFRVIAAASFIIGIVLMLSIPLWYGKSLNSDELSRMKILVFIMVCNTALSFIQTPYTAVASSHERFVFLQIMNIFLTCVGPALNIVVLYLGFASIGMASTSLATTVFTRFAYYLYVRMSIGLKPNYRERPQGVLKEIIVFSFWIFVANVVNQLYGATDTFMIGMVPQLATTGVAVYNVGSVFQSIVFSLTTGISTVISPRTQTKVFEGASNKELTDLAISIGRIQCFIISLIVTGFIAFGKPFVELYAGYDYKEAYWVAIFVMVPSMIPLVQSVCLSIIVAQNKHKFRSLVYLFIAIVNVIGTWFAMKKYGIVGAAAVTGLATILGQGFIMNWYYKAKTGLEIGRFWINVAKIYIIPIIMCVITVIISKYVDFYKIPIFIVGVVIYSLIYCALNWFIIMNDFEKDLFRNPIRNFLVKIRKKNNASA